MPGMRAGGLIESTIAPGSKQEPLRARAGYSWNSMPSSVDASSVGPRPLIGASFPPMMIGGMRVVLHLPDSHSLKDKRQIVRSLLARTRNEFPVSSAEVGDTERWQIAELGFACVNESAAIVTEILEKVVRYIEDTRPDLEILEQAQEIMEMG